ncbi:hypothetical protein PR048_014678 [Dryococelus australis]|uniref:Uncharacterized protein n=1 Tax=Dryococelus australis TaxID=614101 RepID=A0ABQ9HF25_9NEOP|nr:hypothetical protein PR048_014678 [Dryococelus australis]
MVSKTVTKRRLMEVIHIDVVPFACVERSHYLATNNPPVTGNPTDENVRRKLYTTLALPVKRKHQHVRGDVESLPPRSWEPSHPLHTLHPSLWHFREPVASQQDPNLIKKPYACSTPIFYLTCTCKLVDDIQLYPLPVSPLASHQGEPGSIPGWVTSDFHMWESCRTMPLVGGSSPDLHSSPPLHSGAAPYSPQPTSSALKTSHFTSNICHGSQASFFLWVWAILLSELSVTCDTLASISWDDNEHYNIRRERREKVSGSKRERELCKPVARKCTPLSPPYIGIFSLPGPAEVTAKLSNAIPRTTPGREKVSGSKRERELCKPVARKCTPLSPPYIGIFSLPGPAEVTAKLSNAIPRTTPGREKVSGSKRERELCKPVARKCTALSPPYIGIFSLPGPAEVTAKLSNAIPVLRADEGETRCIWSSTGMQERGKWGDRQENPPSSGIFRHDSHVQKSGSVTPPGIEPDSLWWEASSLTACAISSRYCRQEYNTVVSAFTINPCSIPGGVATGFSHVGIAPDDAAGRRVFLSWGLPFPIPALLHFPFRFTLICSQDVGVERFGQPVTAMPREHHRLRYEAPECLHCDIVRTLSEPYGVMDGGFWGGGGEVARARQRVGLDNLGARTRLTNRQVGYSRHPTHNLSSSSAPRATFLPKDARRQISMRLPGGRDNVWQIRPHVLTSERLNCFYVIRYNPFTANSNFSEALLKFYFQDIPPPRASPGNHTKRQPHQIQYKRRIKKLLEDVFFLLDFVRQAVGRVAVGWKCVRAFVALDRLQLELPGAAIFTLPRVKPREKSVQRGTKRWPMVVFFSMLNVGGIYSQAVYLGNGNDAPRRRLFLRQLGRELNGGQLAKRLMLSNLPRSISARIQEILPGNQQRGNSDKDTSRDACGKRQRCKPCLAMETLRLTKYCWPAAQECCEMVLQRGEEGCVLCPGLSGVGAGCTLSAANLILSLTTGCALHPPFPSLFPGSNCIAHLHFARGCHRLCSLDHLNGPKKRKRAPFTLTNRSLLLRNYFPSIVTNFTGRMSLSAPVEVYAGIGTVTSFTVDFKSAHFVVNSLYTQCPASDTQERQTSGRDLLSRALNVAWGIATHPCTSTRLSACLSGDHYVGVPQSDVSVCLFCPRVHVSTMFHASSRASELAVWNELVRHSTVVECVVVVKVGNESGEGLHCGAAWDGEETNPEKRVQWSGRVTADKGRQTLSQPLRLANPPARPLSYHTAESSPEDIPPSTAQVLRRDTRP